MSPFLNEESGATAIEYGLIAALVAVVILVGLGALNLAMTNMYTSVTTTVNNAMGTG